MKHANIVLVTGRPIITEEKKLTAKWGAIAFFDEDLLRQLDTLNALGCAIARASDNLLALQSARCV